MSRMRSVVSVFTPAAVIAALALAAAPRDARADAVADVVITEIMYHPASADKNEEFIELYNMSATEDYNLLNWTFEDGVNFTFPSVVLAHGQYLVVCANEDRIRQLYGITNTVGDWDPLTGLSRGGERIRLLDSTGVEIEDITYNDRNPWPILPDGYGRSLEKRNPAGDNDEPGNWSASEWSPGWFQVSASGTATSEKVYFYLLEAGTAYIDDVQIYEPTNPGFNFADNGDLEGADTSMWKDNGNHSGSSITTESSHSATHSWKIVSTGVGTGSGNAGYQESLGTATGTNYTLSFWIYLPSESQTLVARFSYFDQTESPIYIEVRGGGGATPGQQNSVHATDIPPFVYPVDRLPEAPIGGEPVILRAVVNDDVSVAGVTLYWTVNGGAEQSKNMYDDGAHDDVVPGDSVYGARIGPFATGDVVRYYVTATDGGGRLGRFPFLGNPTTTYGFYIEPAGTDPLFLPRSNSGLESTKPAVYHILVDPSYLDGNRNLTSNDSYIYGTFIYNGEVFDNVRIRHRGQTSLWVSKKHWKVNFNKDHRFRTPFDLHPEVDNINLQSGYGDKTFIREFLSYKAWMDVNRPGLEMWHVRMYLNGVYRGLYMHLEAPKEDWLDRTGLDPEGWLWKAQSQARGGTGGFEFEADGGNQSAGYSALGTFINQMNSLTGTALVNYIDENMDVDCFIDFLAIHQLIHNADHPAKNYLVYADEDAPVGTWTYLGWDMDLTHGRNYECSNSPPSAGPGITYPDDSTPDPGYVQLGVYCDAIRYNFWNDPNLMFGTSARPKCDGPWNGIINAFLNTTTAYRQQYFDRTQELLNTLYHPDVLTPIIEDFCTPLDDEIDDLDWNVSSAQYYGIRNTHQWHVNILKQWVEDRYDYLSTALTNLTVPELSNLTCTRAESDVVLNWTNNDSGYTQIKVYRNGTLHDTLAGSATTATVPLDMAKVVNVFKVASVYNGNERGGQTCTIIIYSGGYMTLIDEDFTEPAGSEEISVNCTAQQVNGVLQLTEPVGSLAGAAFFTTPAPDADFIADFDFRFDEPSSPAGADGLIFAMIRGNDPTLCGAGGGAMGFWQGDGGGVVMPGYGVVFDTYQNEGEPSHNWVGFIDTRASTTGAVPETRTAVAEEFCGTGTFHVRVTGLAGTFTVSLANESIGMTARDILTYTDASFADEDLLFGFTAGTGGAFARHLVDNFVLQIKVPAQPPVAAFTADRTSGEAPLTVTFTNLSTDATSYVWAFGDGGTSTEEDPIHTFESPGTYTVQLTATGEGGTDVEQKGRYISAGLVLAADFSADVTIGENRQLAVNFTDLTAKNVPEVTYLWNFGDGFAGTVQNPTHTYTRAGQFTVSLKVTDPGGGTSSTKTKTNYIRIDDVLDADFTATPVSGAPPLDVEFSDDSTGTTIQSWLWNFGDGETSTAKDPQHTYDAAGLYTVTLVISGYKTVDTAQRTSYIVVGDPRGRFIRGDANGDGLIDISDAIAILGFMFGGGISINCQDAADLDDSGIIDISDPIGILTFLFQEGDAPRAPFPAAGEDTTADTLAACTRGA
jgi:PKD repeat protein